jgi:hypothetical protein
MGATRALVTVKKGDLFVYVNDMTAALSFLELFLKVSSAPAVADLEAEQELVDRIVPVSAALQAQQALRAITGLPAHNLGMATHRALQAGSISRAEASTLRGLRRKANSAKHDWSSDGSGGAATSGPSGSHSPGTSCEDSSCAASRMAGPPCELGMRRVGHNEHLRRDSPGARTDLAADLKDKPPSAQTFTSGVESSDRGGDIEECQDQQLAGVSSSSRIEDITRDGPLAVGSGGAQAGSCSTVDSEAPGFGFHVENPGALATPNHIEFQDMAMRDVMKPTVDPATLAKCPGSEENGWLCKVCGAANSFQGPQKCHSCWSWRGHEDDLLYRPADEHLLVPASDAHVTSTLGGTALPHDRQHKAPGSLDPPSAPRGRARHGSDLQRRKAFGKDARRGA